MADYKDYIVRYDIIADVTKAAEGLQSIANIAKEFEGPMNTLKTAITQVSQSVYQLKQNSQMTFAPKIDVGAFNNQLRAMVTQVRSAAAEIHTAIFQALSGNPAGTKAAQKGIGSALSGTRSVAAIKKDIEDYNKELDKLLGTPKKNKKGETIRSRDGLIQMNKNGLAKATAQEQAKYQGKLLQLESQKRTLQAMIQQRKAELAVAEKLEKETAAQQAKAAKAQSKIVSAPTSKSTATSQPAKLTNVTPAVIREWKKAFGDAKSKALTVNIRGNATGAGGALTVIEQIQSSLKALQSQGTFNINPILNTEGFAAAEAQLKRLAGLSAAVVAPFTPKDTKAQTGKPSNLVSALTKDEKTKLTNAQKQIKAWNEKIAPIQSRLDANRAISEDQRTPAIKGQITRDTKTLAAYQANRAEQENIVRTLQGKSTAATQPASKTAKPLALDIVGNLSKINVTAKAPVVSVIGEITKLQGKVSEAIPVNVRIIADQVAASVKSIPTPTLDVRVNLLTDKAQQQLQTLAAQSKPVAKPVKSTGTTTSVTKGKQSGAKAPITGTVDTKDILSQIKNIPRQTIPLAVKLMWERGAIGRQEQIKKLAGNIPPITLNFETTAALVKLKEFIAKVRASSPQNIKLTTTGVVANATPATTTSPTQKAPTTVAAATKGKKTVTAGQKKPTVGDSTKGSVQTKPQSVALKLDTSAAVAALEEFIAKVRASSPQNIKLTATGMPPVGTQQNATAPATNTVPPVAPIMPPATGGTTQKGQKQSGHTGHQPLTAQERYNKQRQQSEDRARKQIADNRFRAAKRQEYTSQHQAWYNQQQALYNKLFDPVKKPDLNWAYREEQKRAAELAKMREDAKTAFAKPTPFEQQEINRHNQFLARQEEAKKISSTTSISSHRNKLGKMRSAIRNSILPFVSNQGDLESIFKNYKSFAKVNQAWGTIGSDGKNIPFVPTPGMPNGQMLRYLTDVKTQMQADGAAIPVKLNNYIGNLEEQIRQSNTAPTVPQNTLAPSGFMGSGKNRVSFGTAKPSKVLAPKGYHWEKTKNLASRLSNPQMEGFQRALAEKEAAWQNLRNVQSATQGTIDAAKNPRTPYIDRMTSISNTLSTRANTALFTLGHALNAVDRHNNTISSLQAELQNVESQMQPFMAAKSLKPAQASQLTNLAVRSNELKQQIAENKNLLNQHKEIARKADRSHQILTQRKNAIDAARAMEENSVRSAMLAQPMAERRNARAAYTQARRNANAYTHGYQLTADESAKPSKAPKLAKIPHRVRTQSGELLSVEQLRAQAQNAMLPFAQSKEQLNMLTKHRRYFRQAVATTGIMPTPSMEAPQMLKYLQGVSTQMQKASVAVPWTLQSQINKLEGEVAKANGVGQPTQSRGTGMAPLRTGQPKPFFDRSRKWAYPFTGQTSFGARTPMAVDMAKGMGVMFAIGGAMSAIGSSFSQAMEYQNTMRTTQAILQNGTDSYSQNSFKNMEATVRNVGVKTKFSAPEVASAAKFLAMAGYDIDAINAAIRPIADLALIGDSDLGETADKMTNIMTTFQIAPERMREAANIMATTATRSNTDLMMLAESAKYGGAVANMYGRNDPYLFADTMAIFGVMGNAGIQASSAGTALRMMYQNIFNPNKKQAAILQHLDDKYGISTVDANGNKRSMADIIIDMANQIPDDVMPDIVGKLFRITAQSGANSTIVSAKDIALEAAGGDANVASQLINETNELVDRLSEKKNSKKQLSSLAALIQANRNSVSGNISGAIAEEKQNPISGLWAQVTSTFTEGIVQAFENRQGDFEEMLKKLRDYLAKPETIQMMQNLFDMIIEIGKVMAWFVKIWASIYNTAPGLIKTWVTAQMMFTQFGSLVAPIISLIGVFDRLKGSIMTLAGISSVGGATMTGNITRNAIAGTATNAALLVPTPGASQKFAGKIGSKVNSAMATNAILAGELALSGASKSSTLNTLNQETALHYKAVQERYYRRYGWARAGAAFRTAATSVPTMASFAPMFGGLKSMVMNLFVGFSRAIGFLVNPISLATIAIGSLGYGLYKLKQRMDGTTEVQQIAAQKAKVAAQSTARELAIQGKWHNELGANRVIEGSVIHAPQSEKVQDYLKDQERFQQTYNILWNNLAQDASKKSINDTVNEWRSIIKNNSAYKLALGDKYSEYAGADLTKWTNSNKMWNRGPNDLIATIHDIWVEQDDHAIDLQKRIVQGALMVEGANSSITQKYVNDIIALRERVINKEIDEHAYQEETQKILNMVKGLLPSNPLDASNMTPEELKNTSNRSVFAPYQDAIFNVLNAYIRGDYGTETGAINAWQDLTLRNENGGLASGLIVWSQQWYDKLANIAKDMQLTDTFFSPDGTHQENMKIILSMMPDTSKFDASSIVEQVRQKINNFQLTLQQFSDMLSTVYDMLKQAGILDENDNNRYQFIRGQLTGQKFTSHTVRKYWQDNIGINHNSEWVKAGISENDYVNWMMGVKGAMSDLDISKKLGRAITRSQENSQMATNIARKAANLGNKNAALKTPTVSTATPTPTNHQTTPTVKDQQAYASHYDRSAARPTQVVFNINNLANFDRTTVASSAEERDLMAAMEDRIAGAVYQMFAEASNQAQRVMDLT
ncbi:MAG: phage tail tape measure protein [Bacteroides sp.]|nr:phage tail tape measure protein [Bacteroides sp.]